MCGYWALTRGMGSPASASSNRSGGNPGFLVAIQQAGLKVYSYKPMQVKQALVGYGNATKHQMMDMTKRLLHLNEMPKPDDAADAIAIALCHARSSTSLLAKATQGQ